MEVDFSRLDFETAHKVDDILRGTFDQQLVTAARRQQRVAALNHLQRPKAKDGFGERLFQIDPVFDAFWRTCYGSAYTADADLMKFLARRNPEITVRSRGTKEMFTGWLPSSSSKRPVGLAAAGLKPL